MLFPFVFTDEIIDRINESGFKIAATKEQQLTRELAEEFYADHKDKDYYNDLVDHMTRFVCYALEIKDHIVSYLSVCYFTHGGSLH